MDMRVSDTSPRSKNRLTCLFCSGQQQPNKLVSCLDGEDAAHLGRVGHEPDKAHDIGDELGSQTERSESRHAAALFRGRGRVVPHLQTKKNILYRERMKINSFVALL
jgi:hypothetical protein